MSWPLRLVRISLAYLDRDYCIPYVAFSRLGAAVGRSNRRKARRRMVGFVGRLVFAAVVLTALVAAPASAAPKQVVAKFGNELSGATGGLCGTPRGVAINETGNGGVPRGTRTIRKGDIGRALP